ncbi:MAG: PIN domain-containing protein [Acidimicrobiia bacterium]|nr:PIN domain-containing protein [Acidimicrobiia bacterium]MXZ07541.1 PIN domain-containing protein [Acidimicrobiia bacterium]MYF26653.1 PIN domain-containing protein [Acidimicrobiia bacterium]
MEKNWNAGGYSTNSPPRLKTWVSSTDPKHTTVVYDANVLQPGVAPRSADPARGTGLYRAKWTYAILDEMTASVLRANPQLDPTRLERTCQLMIRAVPDCLVTGYEPLIKAVELPDKSDRHVAAAAIRCHAQIIVTNNLKDFPDSALSQFDIKAQSPDQFVHHILKTAYEQVVDIISRQAATLYKPPQSYNQLLDRLERIGLPQTVAAIRQGPHYALPEMPPTLWDAPE